MKLAVTFLFCFLTEILIGVSGLDCYRYTPFEVTRSGDGMFIGPTLATVTTKTCSDSQRCSRLQITDIANETYTALDCVDQNICQNPELWCRGVTGSLFESCEITCCSGNLCAEMNKTKTTERNKSRNIQTVTCSTFTPFQVNIETRSVTDKYSPLENRICQPDEMCGGVIFTDRSNQVHHASSCVNHGHCKKPDILCSKLMEGSNGTFVDCELKCCNESFCLETKKPYVNSSKCFQYDSFSLVGNEVKISSLGTKVKTCKQDEVCSRGTFKDRENNTHVSLDCVAKSVCDNPRILCQHFSAKNKQSPFVQCNIDCCAGNLCYSDSISTSTPRTIPRTTRATLFTPSSSTRLHTHVYISLVIAILFNIWS